jgi:hypothetical protein
MAATVAAYVLSITIDFQPQANRILAERPPF